MGISMCMCMSMSIVRFMCMYTYTSCACACTPPVQARAQQIFALMDHDQSGLVERQEFMKLNERLVELSRLHPSGSHSTL